MLFECGTVAWIPAKGYTQVPKLSWGTADLGDVLTIVFSHLTQREVARASEVCKRWRTAALSPTLWKDWDFYEVTDLSLRWVQRRFLSYGLFMKARGANARSLRLFFRGEKMYAGELLGLCPHLDPIVPLSNIKADAKPLLWHLNHFFEGIDCSELRTVLLGLLEFIGPLSEITPLVRGARALRTLKLHMRDPKVIGDCSALEFTNLRSLHVHSGGYVQQTPELAMGFECGRNFDSGLNCMLAACSRLHELYVLERSNFDANASKFTLASKSVKELKCEGKGLYALEALDMPALRHLTFDISNGFLRIANPGHCLYNLVRALNHLETVTVGDDVFYFPASRGVRSIHTTAEVAKWGGAVSGVPLCECAVCAAADGDGAGAAQ